MALMIQSSAFSNQSPIPSQFSGEGEDMSPPLSWSGVPSNTKELVLICEDPDAPGKTPFVHWLMYNIPPSTTSLPEGISSEARLVEPTKASQGRNSKGDIGYMGPMPPVGHGRHRYFFKLFALSDYLELPTAVSRDELAEAMRGKILATAEIIGTYERATAKKTA